MCVEPLEEPSATTTATNEKEDWLMSIPGVKSLMARLNGGRLAELPSNDDVEEGQWFLSATGQLTKLVGEASEQLATASGGWIANLTQRIDTTHIKVLEEEEEAFGKTSIVAWELPKLFDGVKQGIPLGWSTVRMFLERAVFGETPDGSKSCTEMDAMNDSEMAGDRSADALKTETQEDDGKWTSDGASNQADAVVDATVQFNVGNMKAPPESQDEYEEVELKDAEAAKRDEETLAPEEQVSVDPEKESEGELEATSNEAPGQTESMTG